MATLALLDVTFKPQEATLTRAADHSLVVSSRSPAVVYHSSIKVKNCGSNYFLFIFHKKQSFHICIELTCGVILEQKIYVGAVLGPLERLCLGDATVLQCR